MTNVKVYTVASSTSSRNAISYFNCNGVDFTEHKMSSKNPLSWEQLSEILMGTENGVDDILSEQSNDYKKLVAQGIDFNDLSLTELHEYIVAYPKLIKAPITVAKGVTIVGYSEEEMSIVLDRKRRKHEYSMIYNMLKHNDLKYGFSCENDFAVGV